MGTDGFRRRPGRPRQNWKDVVEKDLRKMGISWDEVEEAAEDRRSWRNRVAQCVFDAGWTRNQEQCRHFLWQFLRLFFKFPPLTEVFNHFCILLPLQCTNIHLNALRISIITHRSVVYVLCKERSWRIGYWDVTSETYRSFCRRKFLTNIQHKPESDNNSTALSFTPLFRTTYRHDTIPRLKIFVLFF